MSNKINFLSPEKFRVPLRFFIQNLKFSFKYYRFIPRICNKKFNNIDKSIVFIIDPSIVHPGLADQLKAIVGSYYIAKCNNVDFYIKFDYPFCLSRFLKQSKCKWEIKDELIEKSYWKTRRINYNPNKLPLINRAVQYHIRNYVGVNHRDLAIKGVETWSNLFNELFSPSDYLVDNLRKIKLYGEKYTAVHLRFVNSFTIAEPKFPGRPLSEERQRKLLDICRLELIKLQNDTGNPVLVFSDSPFFTEYAKSHGFEIIDGKIGHIGLVNDHDVQLKTFIDLFMLAGAERVVSIYNNVLYISNFPEYAAAIKAKTIDRIRIEDV